MSNKNHYPRLLADIGGTNARFTIETSPLKFEFPMTLQCKNYPNLHSAVNGYLQIINFNDKIKHGVLALPTPEFGDTFFMVNSPWQAFSREHTKEILEFDSLIFINDFHALALAIPFIESYDLIQVGGIGNIDETKPKAIIGAGTGLGMATLINHPSGIYYSIPAEGGRSSFPPVSEEEIELWKFVHKRFSHVSAERFLSGPGIQLIYEGLHNIHKKIIDIIPSPSEIVELGTNKKNWFCMQTVDIFCRMFGTVTSNLAVTVNAFGGIYVGGGIIPKMIDYFIQSEFRSRFEDKGRYRPFLVQMPVFVIMQPYPAFYGASYALDVYLNHGYIP